MPIQFSPSEESIVSVFDFACSNWLLCWRESVLHHIENSWRWKNNISEKKLSECVRRIKNFCDHYEGVYVRFLWHLAVFEENASSNEKFSRGFLSRKDEKTGFSSEENFLIYEKSCFSQLKDRFWEGFDGDRLGFIASIE